MPTYSGNGPWRVSTGGGGWGVPPVVWGILAAAAIVVAYGADAAHVATAVLRAVLIAAGVVVATGTVAAVLRWRWVRGRRLQPELTEERAQETGRAVWPPEHVQLPEDWRERWLSR